MEKCGSREWWCFAVQAKQHLLFSEIADYEFAQEQDENYHSQAWKES